MPTMPKSITRTQANEAFQAVYDLLGVTSMEVFEVHFDSRGLIVQAAPRRPDDESERPDGVPLPIDYGPDDARAFEEFRYQATVEVLDA